MHFNFKTIVYCTLFLILGCKTTTEEVANFSSVDIEVIYTNEDLSIRGLEIIAEDTLALAYNTGFGVLKRQGNKFDDSQMFFNFPSPKQDSVFSTLAFRSVAVNDALYALSIGNPGTLISLPYKNKDATISIVYTEEGESVFYDSLAFWDSMDGIAMGDPTNGCLSIHITRDGGLTWNKIACEDLPQSFDGEAAFAASDTNIKVIGDKAWIISGGKASRVFYTEDRGYTWSVVTTPLIQGKETTGGYSIDFYDETNGFIVGGDYTQPDNNSQNKAVTIDGGKSWSLVANNSGIGYKSCVQYVPEGQGKALVAVGFTGISFTSDAGKEWKTLSDEGFYSIRFLNPTTAYATGKGRVAKLTFN